MEIMPMEIEITLPSKANAIYIVTTDGDGVREDTRAEVERNMRHKELCDSLHRMYLAKNADYGDAFRRTYEEEGLATARVRLTDKLERFKTLSRDPDGAKVKSESLRDTLMDLAGYAILTVLELDGTENVN